MANGNILRASNRQFSSVFGSSRSPLITLRDPKPNTNVTSPQARSVPRIDSRLFTDRFPALSDTRIRQLKLDPTISFMRNIVVAPAVHTPWTYKEKENAPAGAKEAIEKAIERCRTCLIQNIFFGCLDYGWAPFEILYHMEDGFISFLDFKQLLHLYTDILVYTDTGMFAGYVNEPIDAENSFIPENFALHVNFEVEGQDWYGLDKMRILHKIQEYWDTVNSSADRFDSKISGANWVLYYPVGKTEFDGVETDNQEIARAILNSMEASGATAIPDEIQDWVDDVDKETKGKWRLELITASGDNSVTFADRLKYLDNLKARAFDIPERSVLEGKFGTKAEAETHADLGLSTIDTKHRIAVAHINAQVVNRFLRFNFGPEAEGSIKIEVAPLSDSRFSTLKEIYRLIIQSPDLAIREFEGIDVGGLREELAIPSTGVDIDQDFSKQIEAAANPPANPFLNNPSPNTADNGENKGSANAVRDEE